MTEVGELREVCAEAARRGGAVLRERWGMLRTIELKGGIDLVTDADRASEAALLAFLAARAPGAHVLAEESGASGATLGATRIGVSGREDLVGALLVTGFPYDVHQRYEYPLRLFGAFVRRARAVRRFGSAALDLAYVACGRFDGFWELALKPWDVAPGILIAREAGAIVTDMSAGDRMLETGDILAATPALHGAMLEIISAETP